MSNHVRIRDWQRGYMGKGQRKKRAKTFKTAESAKAWAEKNKISDYDVVNLRIDPSRKDAKLRVVVK